MLLNAIIFSWIILEKRKMDKVLVNDKQGTFLKMFKRQFKNQFEFSENSLLNHTSPEDFNHFIFVVYNKEEMIEFLKLDKNGNNVLVCIFNKQLFTSLSFLEEIKNLILLDNSKTRTEIVKELKLYFKNTPCYKSESEMSKTNFVNSNIIQTQFHDFYKALFFLL